MSEQYVPNLGHQPAEDARRDAVHIAVAPVVAGAPLYAGTRVMLNKEGEAVAAFEHLKPYAIGLVDPFLPANTVIPKGQRFWLFLYPNTITNLRHVWEHPAFKAKAPEVKDDRA